MFPIQSSTQAVVDVFRVEGGKLAEHWDVLQDEMLVALGGGSMFDPGEGGHRRSHNHTKIRLSSNHEWEWLATVNRRFTTFIIFV